MLLNHINFTNYTAAADATSAENCNFKFCHFHSRWEKFQALLFMSKSNKLIPQTTPPPPFNDLAAYLPLARNVIPILDHGV